MIIAKELFDECFCPCDGIGRVCLIGDYIELGVVDNANELKKYYLETADTKDIKETGWN